MREEIERCGVHFEKLFLILFERLRLHFVRKVNNGFIVRVVLILLQKDAKSVTRQHGKARVR